MSGLPGSRRQRTRLSLAPHLPAGLGRWRLALAAMFDRLLGLARLNQLYARVPEGLDAHTFVRCTLAQLGVGVAMDPTALARIPASGACLVVANHPHGGLDGIAMLELLLRRRTDVKVMANHLLGHFSELEGLLIGVDPFGGRAAARYNIRAVRQALAWLRGGGLLLMFPGGEVSSWLPSARAVRDPAWDSGVGWLAARSQAAVLPVFIEGRNSILFQAVGLLHPRLRTLLLLREMLGQSGTVIEVRATRALDAEVLALLGDDACRANFLQVCSELLHARRRYRRPWQLLRIQHTRVADEALAVAHDPARLAAEVAALPPTQRLVGLGTREAWYARAAQIPWLLQEIGRLRELSFRQVGEGTGRPVDLDLFDSYYLHLFVWDTAARRVVGGYRLGEADRIVPRYGARGLYVHSLFRLERDLARDLERALEVGRSFVAPDYQRDYAALLLLWRGIATFVARHPRYRVLFGPVSISNDYHPVSRQLIVRFLEQTSMEPERASQVKPRRPFRSGARQARLIDLNVRDLRIIASLLAVVEDEAVGVPVLLRQYLKLNGRILGFNVDPQFNNALDCLLWVDLARTEAAHLDRLMGRDGAEVFRAYHGLAADAAAGWRSRAPRV